MTLLRFTAVLFISLLILVIAARFAGVLRGPASIVRALEPGSSQCKQPCWRGIQPGITTPAQVSASLQADGILTIAWPEYLNQICWASSPALPWEGCIRQPLFAGPSVPITRIELRPHVNLIGLGDAILLFGQPLGAMLCIVSSDTLPFASRGTRIAQINFAGNITVFTLAPVRRFDLNMPVRWITYAAPTAAQWELPPWRGFVQNLVVKACPT